MIAVRKNIVGSSLVAIASFGAAMTSNGALVQLSRGHIKITTSKAITTATGVVPNTFGAIAEPAALPHDARQLGPLAPSSTLHLAFALNPRNASGLARAAASISTPNSASYHRYLTPSQIASNFGPTATTIRMISKTMRALGLNVDGISSNHLMLNVTGSVAKITSALHAQLRAIRLSDGHAGWRLTSQALVPSGISHDISAVLGLNNMVFSHATVAKAATTTTVLTSIATNGSHSRSAPLACRSANAATKASGGWTDNSIASAYGLSRLYSSGDLGAGQTIAVVELEPFVMSDIATFDRCYFGTSHTSLIHRVRIAGFNELGSGSGESALDIESLTALAPRATIDVYEAPNTNIGTLDTYNQIVSTDSANLITTSWGECEQMLDASAPGTRQVENFIFEEAAAQGQTFIAATGDSGSDDCATTPFGSSAPVSPYLSVDDPASQPYVLGVGGTSLRSDVQPLTPTSETAWNNGSQGGASGGGVSANWASPSWQAMSGVPGVSTTLGRQVPDVSASADSLLGITVYSASFGQTGWTTIGGTSAAAPIWAATLAEIAASGSAGTSCSSLPLSPGGQDLGFVSPLLYEAAAASYATTFHPIEVGDNDAFHLGLGYAASDRYNMVGGLGSPIVTDASGQPGLANALCDESTQQPSITIPRPTVTNITPAFGPVGGSSSVTINLTQPLTFGAQINVSLDGRTAAVTSVSGSTIEVVAPAATTTNGSAAVTASGPALVSITERIGSVSVTSSPNGASLYEYVNESNTSSVPTVSGVNPPSGNFSGGNVITVYGSGFSTDTPTVTIGGRVAGDVEVKSDFLLTAVVPRHRDSTQCAIGRGFAPGSLCQTQVEVSDTNGVSTTAEVLPVVAGRVTYSKLGVVKRTSTTEVAPSPTEYDYAPIPTIRAIRPDSAPSSGHTIVRIVGRGFSLNTLDWVNFGPPNRVNSQLIRIVSITATVIEVRVPVEKHLSDGSLPGGVSVQSSIGLSKAMAFTYTQPS